MESAFWMSSEGYSNTQILEVDPLMASQLKLAIVLEILNSQSSTPKQMNWLQGLFPWFVNVWKSIHVKNFCVFSKALPGSTRWSGGCTWNFRGLGLTNQSATFFLNVPRFSLQTITSAPFVRAASWYPHTRGSYQARNRECQIGLPSITDLDKFCVHIWNAYYVNRMK